MRKTYLKVGGYMPENEGREAVVDREYYGQGWIFKDEEAFLLHLDQVCYVPELFDDAYTRQNFLDMCNGQEEIACECFYALDWQSPETWLNEQFDTYEMDFCPICQKIYCMMGEQIPCPECGTNPEEVEENADTESESRPAESGGV